MVAIFALIGETFLQPRHEACASASLCLGKALLCLFQFSGMGNLLAIRQRKQMMEAGVHPDHAIARMRNGSGGCIDEETEIPPRSALDNATAFETTSGECLGMESHRANPRHKYGVPHRRRERIRERDTRELISLAFELGPLGEFLQVALPCRISRSEHALKRMTGDVELLTMVGKQIVEVFGSVKDAIVGVQLDLANRPIPDPGELEQPVSQLALLSRIETEFKLSLDHFRLVFDAQYIV
jgi:hypothetical protein